MKYLVKRATDGSASLQTGTQELIAQGYLIIEKLRVKGKFIGNVWRVFEISKKTCDSKKPCCKKPDAEDSETVKPCTEKPNYINNHSFSTNHSKETTTNSVVVSSDEELLEELNLMTEGTPFAKLLPLKPRFTKKGIEVVYHALDRLVYQCKFLQWKPESAGAILVDGIENGIEDPPGFIPFKERLAQNKRVELERQAKASRQKEIQAEEQQKQKEFCKLSKKQREFFMNEAGKKLPSFLKGENSKRDFIQVEAIELYAKSKIDNNKSG